MSRNFDLLRQAEEERNLRTQTVVTPEPIMGAIPVSTPTSSPVSVPHLPDGRLRDELVKLTRRLFPASTGIRSVVFTAVEPGAGCSWMVYHVAKLLASHVAGSVCVVDGNFRGPSLHEHFKSENKIGLADALRGVPLCSLVRRVDDRNLWLLSCGTMHDNERAVMASQAISACLAELRSRFEYVLVDAPLIGHVETIPLAQATDGVVLILAENSTKRQAADEAIHELQKSRIRVLGGVFNKRTFPIPEVIYKRL